MSSFYAIILVGFLVLTSKYECSGSYASDLRVAPIISPSNDSLELERQMFMSSLTTKLSAPANMPIFEFGRDITNFLTKAEEVSGYVDPSIVMELELMFFDYMTKLSYYYQLQFCDSQSEIVSNGLLLTASSLAEEKDHTLRQCRKAMQSALPSNLVVETWSFEGPLLELESDLDAFIGKILPHFEEDAASSKRQKRPLFLRKLMKRFKWVGIQAALLGFNFAQTEWHRRSMKHLADRRLAEVPEFPLLFEATDDLEWRRKV